MRLVYLALIGGLLSSYLTACVSAPIRLPASFKPSYDNEIVNALHSAAVNGVLFQFNDSVFRDVDSQQVDQCRKALPSRWSDAYLELLKVLNQNPQYYGKFHMVEFKRGDKAGVELVKDIDGLTTLTVSYDKREIRHKVTSATLMPCGDSVADNIDKDLIISEIDWPTKADMIGALDTAPEKAKISRFEFNTDFLVYLAERQTILKINPEVAFERTFDGDYFLKSWLEDRAQELKDPKTHLDFIDYWLKEISLKSAQAHQVGFFSLHPESPVASGVEINTNGKFARKISSIQEPTYVFMSYGESNGQYVSDGLQELNDCLRQLTGLYMNPLEMGTSLDSDPDGFLAPGYSCRQKEP